MVLEAASLSGEELGAFCGTEACTIASFSSSVTRYLLTGGGIPQKKGEEAKPLRRDAFQDDRYGSPKNTNRFVRIYELKCHLRPHGSTGRMPLMRTIIRQARPKVDVHFWRYHREHGEIAARPRYRYRPTGNKNYDLDRQSHQWIETREGMTGMPKEWVRIILEMQYKLATWAAQDPTCRLLRRLFVEGGGLRNDYNKTTELPPSLAFFPNLKFSLRTNFHCRSIDLPKHWFPAQVNGAICRRSSNPPIETYQEGPSGIGVVMISDIASARVPRVCKHNLTTSSP